MDTQQLSTRLNQPFNLATWQQIIGEIFKNQGIQIRQQPQAIAINKDNIERCEEVATLTTADEKEIGFYCVQVSDLIRLEKNKVGLRNSLQTIYNQVDGAIIVFYQQNQPAQWRLSFVSEIYKYNEQEDELQQKKLSGKRYTYLLGEGVQIRTPAENLSHLISKKINLQDIEEAFSVEALNKEFYAKLYKWYERANEEVVFPNDVKQENHTQISLIRLLTRLLFVWFLKEKDLINKDFFDQEEVKKIIDYHQPNSYYKAIIQNLFFATLNRAIKDRSFRTTDKNGQANGNNYLVQSVYRYENLFQKNLNKQDILKLFENTPFLNGGLFECLDREATDEEKQYYDAKAKDARKVKSAIRLEGFSDRADNPLTFPNALFFNDDEDEDSLGLISLLQQYKFTVEESTPLDIEVALDPELLGKIFENLLASYNPETGEQARKATGSFYTPREIVHYMVDESLNNYLKQQSTCSDDIIDSLFTHHTEDEKNPTTTLNEQQKWELVQLIDNIKILDPAVGSGAFAMGMLNRLIEILQLLDPENNYFKQQQIEKANEITDEASKNVAIEGINGVFSEHNKYNNYGKKLYLIQNAIYGLDIQPIAIQICKLRFFISLVIEQDTNDNKDKNYGIKELPNLETKFVITDGLLNLPEPQVKGFQGMADPTLKNLREKLAEVRKKYFNAKTPKTKQKYKDSDKKLRQQAKEELVKNELFISDEIIKSIEKIIEWDLYNPDEVADWFDSKWMFGVENGFDIVIGNPPYIQLQKNGGKLGNRYKDCGYQSFAKTGDIYALFYEQGLRLSKPESGLLAFITSNKWMRAGYGKKLRTFLANKSPIQLIDFGGFKVFESATVDTNILLVQNKHTDTDKHKLQACSIAEDYQENQDLKNYVEENSTTLSALSDETWFIASKAELDIKAKIEAIGTPLKDWDVEINYGIKTGYNEAFIIDTAKRNEIIDNCIDKAERERTKALIKPILRGRDIRRYEYQWAGLWLVGTFPALNLNIDDYPIVKNYLASFGKRLHQAGKTYLDEEGKKQTSRKKTGNQWFETQDQIAYYQDFEKEKVVWTPVNGIYSFTFLENNFYFNNSLFMMTSKKANLKYLLSVLNSRLIQTKGMEFFTNLGSYGNYAYGSKDSMINLPIPKISAELQAPFEYLADYIMFCKQHNVKDNYNQLLSPWFEEIVDVAVFGLYFQESMEKQDCYITEALFEFFEPLQGSDEEKKSYLIEIFNEYKKEPFFAKALLNYHQVAEVKIILHKG